MLRDMYNRETMAVYKFLVFTTQTVEQTARTTGGKELLLRIDRAMEKNLARAEQEELAPSLAAGRSHAGGWETTSCTTALLLSC